MGIRYSQLPRTSAPTSDDLVAILDMESMILKTTTIDKFVKAVMGPIDLGTTDITDIGDGTVSGAIRYTYDITRIESLTEAQYNALPVATKNDGKVRLVT